MKVFSLVFFLYCLSLNVSAQQHAIKGFVVDKDSKLRLAKVYIYNSANDEGIYNTPKGEFTIKAKAGDTLFAVLQGYALDTVVVKGRTAVYFQLKSLGIALREVAIIGDKYTPRERHDQTLKEYKYQLDKGKAKDLINLGLGGVGLGIDAIYNLLSREGKNARHLQKILERDYRESIIDYRFKPDYVQRVLQIGDYEAMDFMQQYRPSYDFVLNASDYAFVVYLRNNYANYKRNPAAFRLPALPKIIVEQF